MKEIAKLVQENNSLKQSLGTPDQTTNDAKLRISQNVDQAKITLGIQKKTNIHKFQNNNEF